MRRFALSTAPLMFALTACGSSPEAENATSNAAGTLTVKALEVRSGPGGARMLSGRFEIREPRQGEQSVADATVGGACLVAQVPIDPKACTVANDCKISGQDFFPYCSSGQCWVKPKNESCVRGVGEGSYETPQKDVSEIYTYLAAQGEGRPVSWMVLGCLSGPLVNGLPGCRTGIGTHMNDYGNPRKVP